MHPTVRIQHAAGLAQARLRLGPLRLSQSQLGIQLEELQGDWIGICSVDHVVLGPVLDDLGFRLEQFEKLTVSCAGGVRRAAWLAAALDEIKDGASNTEPHGGMCYFPERARDRHRGFSADKTTPNIGCENVEL